MSNTVFVVGAGASREVGLPIGIGLKKDISNLLNLDFDFNSKLVSGDQRIADALIFQARKLASFNQSEALLDRYLEKANQISVGLPLVSSIDKFVDLRRDDEDIAFCAKLAIVRSILEAENKSDLFQGVGVPIDFKKLENTWYNAFFDLISQNCSVDELGERLSKITLIVFNYDRCIEHFLFNALKAVYSLTPEEAAEMVNKLNIYHPYGSVGQLPYFKSDFSVPFGRVEMLDSSQNLLVLSERIRTFSEGTSKSSSAIENIRKKVHEAGKLVFLGFGFLDLNMKLLSSEPLASFNINAKCFATAKGISASDIAIHKKEIEKLVLHDIDVNIQDLTCAEFFHEFRKSLSF